ncbi:MAG: metal-dependent hydrolase [Nanopusillaceae archaeon]
MVKITWLGHSSFLIESKDTKILIDPFLNGNPLSPVKPKDLNNIDIILVTHGHGDHLGDTVEIAKKNNSQVVAIYELANYLSEYGIKTIGINYGGSIQIKNTKILMVPAWHSSGIIENEKITYTGNPCGYVIEIDGKKIYHAGDTGLFKDMELIPKISNGIDIALLPIGGRYTMDIDQAIIALEMLKPKFAIPMHYNTFPLIKTNPNEFKEKAKRIGVEVIILDPGKSFEI